MSFSSGRNESKNIIFYPLPEIILTGGHLYPWMPTPPPLLTTTAKTPEIISIPQELVEYRDGDFEGIKLYASRALSHAQLEPLSRALEILRDQNMLGRQGVTFSR